MFLVNGSIFMDFFLNFAKKILTSMQRSFIIKKTKVRLCVLLHAIKIRECVLLSIIRIRASVLIGMMRIRLCEL